MNKIIIIVIIVLTGCVSNTEENQLISLKQELEAKLKTLKDKEEIESLKGKIKDVNDKLLKYENKSTGDKYFPKTNLVLFDSSSIHSKIIGNVDEGKELKILNEYIINNPNVGILLNDVSFYNFTSSLSDNYSIKSLYDFLLQNKVITDEITYEQYALGCLNKETQHELFLLLKKLKKVSLTEAEFKNRFFSDFSYQNVQVKQNSLVEMISEDPESKAQIILSIWENQKLIAKILTQEIQRVEEGRWINVETSQSLKGWLFVSAN